jgi:predicted phosphodiesterase
MGLPVSKERCCEIGEYVDEHGKRDAELHFNLSAETIKRYYTQYLTDKGEIKHRDQVNITISRLLEKFTPQELKAIADGKSFNPEQQERPVIDLTGEVVTIGFITDSHIGSKYFIRDYWTAFVKECEKEEVDYVVHAGDLIEGMSNRPDHVYSLTHIGFSDQMDYATELLSEIGFPVFIIDGNHDRWGIKSNGIFAVKDVAARLDHVTFLGHDTGDIVINGTTWQAWHGEDGNSYATSYRLQKIVESLRGGEKPHVMLCGHTHKQGYFFERNIHVVSGGALSTQSRWMKGKRIPNHDGFHIIKACIGDGEIKWFEPRFYPFY